MLSRLTAAARSDRGLIWMGALDALIIGLALLALAIFLTGGFVFNAAGLRISLKSEVRALAAAAVLLALRQGLRPAPAIWTLEALERTRAHTRALTPRLASRALAVIWPVVLTTRFAVLLVGFIAVTSFGLAGKDPPPRVSSDELANLPFRWDACWYINIATAGYRPDDNVGAQQNLNFFPAMPMAVRAVSALIEGPRPGALLATWVGTGLAIIAFLAAMLYVYRLAQTQFGDDVALRSVTLISAYPFSVFFSVPYTESFFLLACAGAFFHCRRGEPIRALLWGIIAGLCRPNGLVLVAPLAFMLATATHRLREEGHPDRDWRRSLVVGAIVACGPIIGLLIYSAAVWQMTGHPFYWADLQREAWGRTFHGPTDIFRFPADVIRALGVVGFIERRPVDAFHALVAALALISIVPVTRRLGIAAGLFQAGSVLLPLVNGGLTSFGRFSSVQFPAFIWLASVLPARWFGPTLVLFGIGQAMAAAFFFTWRPLF